MVLLWESVHGAAVVLLTEHVDDVVVLSRDVCRDCGMGGARCVLDDSEREPRVGLL